MEFPLQGKLKNPLLWILGIMTGGILVVGLMTYRMVETPSSEQLVEQLTVPATKETLAAEIEASGTVEPIESVNISPKNPGRLVQLRVTQGMRVKKGQILAVMENFEIQAQGYQAQAKFKQALAQLKEAQLRIPGEIAQAKTRLAQAQASLKQAQAKLPKDIKQAQAQLQAAEARFQLAQARIQRNGALLKEGAVTQDEYDAVLNDFRTALATGMEAQQRFEQAKTTSFPEIDRLKAAVAEAQVQLEQRQKTAEIELAQLQAAAEAARAELERIKIQYQDTFIRAPFDGVVTQKYATVGAFVTPTTSASATASATSASILALANGLEVVAKVPEVDIGQLQLGQPARIVADAYPDKVFQGQVVKIAPEAVVEQNVTSFEVTVRILTGQETLRSKMNVDVDFVGRQLSNALVVPTVAIVTQEGQTGVMVPDENQKPMFKPVTIGLVLNDKTQILNGLTPGERVFVDLPENKDQKEIEK
ncbi:efflux transporter periplasmic adaptor subunit [Hydrococcus rivularis NIES-593]|uniref:Efflux transporter periplasmic adaptor subunit n=1 Tax=Hydrococcus rivularis NIES-593 TaxID=1921803 RepID=A0A1U7HGS8_9CYAN|nr:efflux RND transporter periplasmic adaptor subunit [Hydrococcus rivularis]OKH22769.1 efflux transporter periplasmic adaptor subunit [Hydrococcus rivularis NIES-593]